MLDVETQTLFHWLTASCGIIAAVSLLQSTSLYPNRFRIHGSTGWLVLAVMFLVLSWTSPSGPVRGLL